MRPKKIVLCADANELALSVRKFFLETRGFKVLAAKSMSLAMKIFQGSPVDVVVVEQDFPGGGGNVLIGRMKALRSDTPMILTSRVLNCGDITHGADAFLGKNYNSPIDVLERVRTMCARKRGPKPARVVTQEMVS